MLQITQAQYDRVSAAMLDGLAVRIARWLAEQPDTASAAGPATPAWCAARIRAATDAGIETEADVADWVRIALLAGDAWFHQPGATEILNSARAPDLKMFQLRHLFEGGAR